MKTLVLHKYLDKVFSNNSVLAVTSQIENEETSNTHLLFKFDMFDTYTKNIFLLYNLYGEITYVFDINQMANISKNFITVIDTQSRKVKLTFLKATTVTN